jgi:hypothetical protein
VAYRMCHTGVVKKVNVIRRIITVTIVTFTLKNVIICNDFIFLSDVLMTIGRCLCNSLQTSGILHLIVRYKIF